MENLSLADRHSTEDKGKRSEGGLQLYIPCNTKHRRKRMAKATTIGAAYGDVFGVLACIKIPETKY